MATYTEIRSLMSDSVLRNKVEVACIIAADTIRKEAAGVTNHVERLRWANQTWNDSRNAAKRMLPAVLAANKDVSIETILAAADLAIQNNIDAAVDVFALQIPAP